MIIIDSKSLSRIFAQATLIFPDECCGFLFGLETANGDRQISEILEVNNAKPGDKRRRFEISAKDYMHAERFAADQNIQLFGVYHSHPNHPAIPSETDRIAALPFFSYVIVSVMQGQIDHIRSWRLDDESQFEEELYSSIHLNQAT